MKRSIDLQRWMAQKTEFKSRDEARFAGWCDDRGIKWEYEPEPIWSMAERWTPDFKLPDLNTLVEIKPVDFAFEVHRIKRVIIRAISRGERFWTWFIAMDRGIPIIMEMTRPAGPEEDGDEQFHMSSFCPMGHRPECLMEPGTLGELFEWDEITKQETA